MTLRVFVRKILPDVAAATSSLPPKGENFGACPQCEKGVVVQTPKGAGCHRWKEGCNFTIWRDQYGKTLTDTHIKDLVEKRETKLIKGLTKKDGVSKYDAKLVVCEDFKIRPEGSALVASTSITGGAKSTLAELGPCPQCKQGIVRPTPKGGGCSRWREGCTFSVWREVSGVVLTDELMQQLVQKGKTDLIRGFKKKSGTGTYDARLFVNAEWKVRFEFDNAPQGPGPVSAPVV